MKHINTYMRQHGLTSKPDAEIKPKFLCGICKRVMQDPQITKCGCRFCRGCVESAITHDEPGPCPQCHAELTDPATQVVHDFAVEAKLLGLSIVCPHPACVARTTIGDMMCHLQECIHKPTSARATAACPLVALGCSITTLKSPADVQAHLAETLPHHFSLVLDNISSATPLVNNDVQQILKELIMTNNELKSAVLENAKAMDSMKLQNFELRSKLGELEKEYSRREENTMELIKSLKDENVQVKNEINNIAKSSIEPRELKYIRSHLAEMARNHREKDGNWKKEFTALNNKLQEIEKNHRENKENLEKEISKLKKSIDEIDDIPRIMLETEEKIQKTTNENLKKIHAEIKTKFEKLEKNLSNKISNSIEMKLDAYNVESSENQFKFVFKDVKKTKQEKNITGFTSDKFRLGGYKFVIMMNYPDDILNFAVSLVKNDKDRNVTWPLMRRMKLMVFYDGGRNKENVAMLSQFCYDEANQRDKPNYDRPTKFHYHPIEGSKIIGLKDTEVIHNDKIGVLVTIE